MLGREGDTQGRHNGVWIPIDAIARVERCVSERIDNVTTLVEVSPSPEQHQLENRTPTVATCPCDVRHHEGWKLERVSLQKWSRKQCKSDNWQLIFLNGSTRSFVDKASVLVLEAYDGCSKIYTTKLANSLVTSAHFIHDFSIRYSNSCCVCRLAFLPFRVLLGPMPRGLKHTFPFVDEFATKLAQYPHLISSFVFARLCWSRAVCTSRRQRISLTSGARGASQLIHAAIPRISCAVRLSLVAS